MSSLLRLSLALSSACTIAAAMVDLAELEAKLESGNIANTFSIDSTSCLKVQTPKSKTGTKLVETVARI